MTPLSFLQRDYRTCEEGYELLVFGQVEGRERKREHGKKNIQKPSSSPTVHPGEEEEQCCSKQHRFGLLLLFFK
jgi:hypothetical protein